MTKEQQLTLEKLLKLLPSDHELVPRIVREYRMSDQPALQEQKDRDDQ
jgi:hypothetical protein